MGTRHASPIRSSSRSWSGRAALRTLRKKDGHRHTGPTSEGEEPEPPLVDLGKEDGQLNTLKHHCCRGCPWALNQPPLKADLQFAQTLIDNCRDIFQWTCYFPNTCKRPQISRLGRKTPNDLNRRGFVTPQPLRNLWGRLSTYSTMLSRRGK